MKRCPVWKPLMAGWPPVGGDAVSRCLGRPGGGLYLEVSEVTSSTDYFGGNVTQHITLSYGNQVDEGITFGRSMRAMMKVKTDSGTKEGTSFVTYTM